MALTAALEMHALVAASRGDSRCDSSSSVALAALAVSCSAQAPDAERQRRRRPRRAVPARRRRCRRCSTPRCRRSRRAPASGSSTSTTGEEAAVRGDEVFNSASVIKIPVAIQALEMAEAKRLDLGKRLTLTAADVRGGSGIFRYHDAGLQPTDPRRPAADDHHQRQHRHRPVDRAGRRRGQRQRLARQRRLRRRHEAHPDHRRALRQVQRAGAHRRPQRQDQRRQQLLAGRADAAGHRPHARGRSSGGRCRRRRAPRSCCG